MDKQKSVLINTLKFITSLVLAGFVTTAAATPPTPVDELLQSMSDEQKAAQLIMVYFASPEFTVEHEFGAVLIMQNMIKDAGKLSARLDKLQHQSSIGVLTAIDQEGGTVNRLKYLPGWKNTPSAATQSKWTDNKIYKHQKKVATKLNSLGININLAPVLDPGKNHHNKPTLMGKKKRSFEHTPYDIASKAAVFIQAHQDKNVLTISKHFPGYDAENNSDHEIAISDASRNDLNNYIQPFWALAPIVDGVMMSSIHYQNMTDRPAVLSPEMVNWAREIHPEKIIITDDLWGLALRSWINPVSAKRKKYPDKDFLKLTRMALEAGNDMLMITYPKKAVLMKKAIANWMKEDKNLHQQINQSVKRILSVKEKAGLLQ